MYTIPGSLKLTILLNIRFNWQQPRLCIIVILFLLLFFLTLESNFFLSEFYCAYFFLFTLHWLEEYGKGLNLAKHVLPRAPELCKSCIFSKFGSFICFGVLRSFVLTQYIFLIRGQLKTAPGCWIFSLC